jgi:hypothetical protein
MKWNHCLYVGLLTSGLLSLSTVQADMPAITGKPVVDIPKLLAWPQYGSAVKPDITEPTANTLNDLTGNIRDCDIMLSTAGNYHMALTEFWPSYLALFPESDRPRNWFYTTSPPVAPEQIANHNLKIGNLQSTCRPQVAVGPKRLIEKLKASGVTDGAPVEVFVNRGSVLLVKKGNPKHIRGIWDLASKDVALATPNPETEAGSFESYRDAIYGIAANDPQPPAGLTADILFNRIFNTMSGNPDKWLAGARIHHREVPWSVAYGKADVGILYYHLALHAVRQFPDQFEIVPLGGTVENPQPLPGNKPGSHYAVRIQGDWSTRQLLAREKLIEALTSSQFGTILVKHGMQQVEPKVASAP